MKPGDIVQTPDGTGIITGKESIQGSRAFRYGVKLENNKYDYPVAYYWPHEIKTLNNPCK